MDSVVMMQDHRPARTVHRDVYRSTKTYDFTEGLSCCFRQWRATHSHCSLVHGYALSFKFIFATHELDERNWCFDFGGMKEIKTWLKHMFDHTMIVAADDPHIDAFQGLADKGLVDLRIMPAVGCEATARYTFDHVAAWLANQIGERVWLESVEVREHDGNSAIFERRQG